MPGYEIVWSDVPFEQYRSLPPYVQSRVDETLALLRNDPECYGVYDKDADHWSATFGDGAGFILYVVSHERVKVVLLRIISV